MRTRSLLIVVTLIATACVRLNIDREVFEDPEVAMVMRIANMTEVREGSMAREKAAEPAVRDFASMMVTEHGMANSRAESELFKEEIVSRDSKLSRELDAESGSVTERLRNLTGRAFDRAYMERQIQAHQNVLNLIDTQLLPKAHEKVVKDQLSAMRETVQAHLTRARSIFSTLPQ